jgi:hypothetical protein
MWKPEHRRAADGNGLRYPNDLTSPPAHLQLADTTRRYFFSSGAEKAGGHQAEFGAMAEIGGPNERGLTSR